jgi:murein L,D-transpeptidase YafK
MKTAIFLGCLIAGSGMMLNSPAVETSASNLPAAKITKSKKYLLSVEPKSPIQIIVDKSSYELYVYDADGWYATYPVVFGNSSLEDKKVEGDRNTPEGTFKIVNKRVHEKWDRYMGLIILLRKAWQNLMN